VLQAKEVAAVGGHHWQQLVSGLSAGLQCQFGGGRSRQQKQQQSPFGRGREDL